MSAEITGPIVTQISPDIISEVHKAKKQLSIMVEKKYSGPLVDCFRQTKLILGYLAEFTPKEWNNIPIPLQELSIHLIGYDQINSKATNLINKQHLELISIA